MPQRFCWSHRLCNLLTAVQLFAIIFFFFRILSSSISAVEVNIVVSGLLVGLRSSVVISDSLIVGICLIFIESFYQCPCICMLLCLPENYPSLVSSITSLAPEGHFLFLNSGSSLILVLGLSQALDHGYMCFIFSSCLQCHLLHTVMKPRCKLICYCNLAFFVCVFFFLWALRKEHSLACRFPIPLSSGTIGHVVGGEKKGK